MRGTLRIDKAKTGGMFTKILFTSLNNGKYILDESATHLDIAFELNADVSIFIMEDLSECIVEADFSASRSME